MSTRFIPNSLKRFAAIAFLAGGVLLLRGAPASACVDFLVCDDGCSFNWQSCYNNCGSCAPDADPSLCNPDACRDNCDSIYQNCESNCFNNACA